MLTTRSLPWAIVCRIARWVMRKNPVGAGNACGLFKRALLTSEVAGVGGACALKLTCSRFVGRCGLVSGCLAVLVDESVAAAVSSDRSAGPIFDDFAIVGCALSETAVRPTGVVVRDVFVEQPFEVAVVPDEGAVQEFAAHRANPAFRERVRDGRTRRGADDRRSGASEHLIERADELAGVWVPKTRLDR
jgi:hypothetical protein